MKIGILGSGVVGQTLTAGFLKHGYEVMIGSRDPQKLEKIKSETGESLKTGTFTQTAEFAEISVLAVKGSAATEVIKLAGLNNLEGKTIIDATNPISNETPVNGVLKFFTDQNGSLMEELQKIAPGINFVKAFNSIGYAVMVNPDFNSKPTMFICGNNDAAKKQVSGILHMFGWEIEDMGKAEAARAIEPLCMLWCIPGFLENRWTHAFKLLKM